MKRLRLVASILIVAGMVVPAAAAGATGLGSVVVSSPGPGFREIPSMQGIETGELSAAGFRRLSAGFAELSDRQLRAFTGYFRAWERDLGEVVVILAVQPPDGAGAALLQGGIAEVEEAISKGATRNRVSGIPGALGYHVKDGRLRDTSLVFAHRGRFFVLFVTGPDRGAVVKDMVKLAKLQYARAVKMPLAAPRNSIRSASSEMLAARAISYQVGRIAGALVVLILVAWLIVRFVRGMSTKRGLAPLPIAGYPPPPPPTPAMAGYMPPPRPPQPAWYGPSYSSGDIIPHGGPHRRG